MKSFFLKHFLLLVVVMFYKTSIGQETNGFFIENNFAKQNNKWELYSTNYSESQIKDSTFYFESFSKKGSSRLIETGVKSDEYIIETNICYTIKNKYATAGVVYSFEDWDNFSCILFERNRFNIIEFVDGKKYIKTSINQTEALKPNEYNKLRINVEKGKIEFYINDNNVFNCTASNIYLNKVGYLIYHKGSIKSNYFNVKSKNYKETHIATVSEPIVQKPDSTSENKILNQIKSHTNKNNSGKGAYSLNDYYTNLINQYKNNFKTDAELVNFANEMVIGKAALFDDLDIIIDWPEADKFINDILVNILPPDSLKNIKVYIINSDEVNAFALEDGSLMITARMMNCLKSESMLAAIMGHELAHYFNKDALKDYIKQRKSQSIDDLLFFTSHFAPIASITGIILNYKNLMTYSKSIEYAADSTSFALLNKSKYSNRGLTQLFETLIQLQIRENKLSLKGLERDGFHSHPSSVSRLRYSQNWITAANNIKLNYVEDSVKLNSIKNRALDYAINYSFYTWEFNDCIEMCFKKHLQNPNDNETILTLIEALRKANYLNDKFIKSNFITYNYNIKKANVFSLKNYNDEAGSDIKKKSDFNAIRYNLNPTIFLEDTSWALSFAVQNYFKENITFKTNNDALNYFTNLLLKRNNQEVYYSLSLIEKELNKDLALKYLNTGTKVNYKKHLTTLMNSGVKDSLKLNQLYLINPEYFNTSELPENIYFKILSKKNKRDSSIKEMLSNNNEFEINYINAYELNSDERFMLTKLTYLINVKTKKHSLLKIILKTIYAPGSILKRKATINNVELFDSELNAFLNQFDSNQITMLYEQTSSNYINIYGFSIKKQRNGYVIKKTLLESSKPLMVNNIENKSLLRVYRKIRK